MAKVVGRQLSSIATFYFWSRRRWRIDSIIIIIIFLTDWNDIFWCKIYVVVVVVFCFVFLFLIPGRRQLPKLRKFPGVVSWCRLHPSPPSKKYVCKQTFDCCRECNHAFYICISMAGYYTYRACIMTERTNACATVLTKKSYSELPCKLPTLSPTNKPTAKP